MFTSIKKIVFLIALIGLTACQFGDDDKQTIIIQTPSGEQVAFDVSVAKTDDEQKQGLMFVDDMPLDEGMIFLYKKPRRSLFWMKDTLIPLDMLFFDQNNELIHIEHSATPLDESPRGPNGKICSVVELNGGVAMSLELGDGTKLLSDLPQECLQSSS